MHPVSLPLPHLTLAACLRICHKWFRDRYHLAFLREVALSVPPACCPPRATTISFIDLEMQVLAYAEWGLATVLSPSHIRGEHVRAPPPLLPASVNGFSAGRSGH
jgi:hypothetical protein